MPRCVNIDWLEVYCLEAKNRFPCNADYYRHHGYFVREREYGTRQYREMFTIEDAFGHPFLEIRRNPATDSPDFNGFVPQSTHIRMVNRYCYNDDPVGALRDFLILHDYIFKSIFRIDICYDFTIFDSGDLPERFARRYVERRFRKINQCHLATHAQDNWTDFAWETLSWGNPKSMVTTKLYNKSKELARTKHDKPYIKQAWFESGLVDNPVTLEQHDEQGNILHRDVWRIEFSIHASHGIWTVIEDTSGKRIKKKEVPHTLSLFDSREKLWRKFEELAYHYFRFVYADFKQTKASLVACALESITVQHDREPQRKDRCRPKILIHFNQNRKFYHLKAIAYEGHANTKEERLLIALQRYREFKVDAELRRAIDIVISELERDKLRLYTPHGLFKEIEALQRAIAIRYGMGFDKIQEMFHEIKPLLEQNEIF